MSSRIYFSIQGYFNIKKITTVIHDINRLEKKITWPYELMQKKHWIKFNTHSWQNKTKQKLLRRPGIADILVC